jgi:hypothetical protein
VAREVIDTYLDRNGEVTTDPKQGVEMRRVEMENGQVVKTAVYYNERHMPSVEAPAKPRTGYERPRGY